MGTHDELIAEIVGEVLARQHQLKLFADAVRGFFDTHPDLQQPPLPVVHSTKSRLKSEASLRDKLQRKLDSGKDIRPDNVFQELTDLAGVRVLHLHTRQFEAIHAAITTQVDNGEWVFDEPPKAYTWDPEAKHFFEGHQLAVEIKDSFYTSVHYLVRPRADAPWCCEIQVRTLFEEVWGEVDHYVNYPHSTNSLAIREQLKVLAKLVATGTRLVDSVFAVNEEQG